MKLTTALCSLKNQVERLLRYADQQRAMDTRAKYILLHDYRLYAPELHYLWRRFVNVIFLRQYDFSNTHFSGRQTAAAATKRTRNKHPAASTAADDVWFELSTVPFPVSIREVFVARRLDFWRAGRFQNGARLFSDRSGQFNGARLRGVVLQHSPAVAARPAADGAARPEYTGVEVDIVNALAGALNFSISLYETSDASVERWGRPTSDTNNGTATGLIGEMLAGAADFALGDLYYDAFHLDKMDLSEPYTTQCLTFLTPESMTDNAWHTLMLPFSAGMWAGVLGMLAIVVAVFYALGQVHLRLRRAEAAIVLQRQRRLIGADGAWLPQRPRRFCVYLEPPHRRLKRRWNGGGRLASKRHAGGWDTVTIRHRMRPKEPCEGFVDLDLFDTLGNCALYTYSMLLLVSLPRLPRSWSVRMMTGWYWTYCILVVVAYRATLTAILANPAPK